MTSTLLVVFTGGTIGSKSSEESIDVASGETYKLLERYKLSGEPSADFTHIEPMSILSENAKPQDWAALQRAILASPVERWDGIIVTHGTDTLPYTAAALSFALSDLPVPIVLVASNHPLDDVRANGHDNFRDAVRFVQDHPGKGVFVPYVNPDGRHLVHRGARLLSASPGDHFFRSISGSEEGEYVEDVFVPFGGEAEPQSAGALPSPIAASIGDTFESIVLFVQPYPGLDYSRISLEGVQAVVHDLYHSGTMAVHPGPAGMSILDLAKRCDAGQVPLFLAPWPRNTMLYESARELRDTQVHVVPEVAASATYVKVMYGLGRGLDGEALRRFVADVDVGGEHIPERGASTSRV